jgi:hypothetical protein
LSTWTKDEYNKLLGDRSSYMPEDVEMIALPETNVTSVDWRTAGAINPI